MTDTTPPALLSLSIPTTIDLSSGPETATFTGGATDDSSGVSYMVVNFDKSFAGAGSSIYIFGSAAAWMSGTSSQSMTFAVNTLPGLYTVTSVDVFDIAGNESIYGTSALQQRGIATTLNVSGSDTAGPVLTGLSFDSTVNLSAGDATFHFAASATDRSGIGSVIIRFDNGFGTAYIFGSAADSWADGSSSSTNTIGVSTPPGTYHVTEVDLQDTAGNSSVYTAAQLQALNLPTAVTVTGSDTTGPVLTALSFDSKVDLSAGDATFHFAASATDRSGIGSVIIRFDNGFSTAYIFGSAADSWADGSSSSTNTISVSTPPGTYHVTEVDLQDTAGNNSVYTAAQLQALGFATSVTVSASDVTGPTLTGFTHPTSVNLGTGAASVTLGVSATDRSGISSAAIHFDKALFATGATAYIFGTTADPWTDGSSTDTETVPVSAAPGVYTVTSLDVTDTAGNTSTYTTQQLAALGYSTTITVAGTDTTPPQLTSLTMPSTVDVSATAKTITLAAAATDNASGIKDVTVHFDKSFSGAAGIGTVDISGSSADPWTDGASSIAVSLPVSTLPGVYTITDAVVTDGAGNTRTYTTAQLQAIGSTTSITVVGDSTKPQLTGLTLPQSIDVSGGQRVAAFAATATDNATGIRDVTIYFDKDLTTGTGVGVVDLNGAADSWTDGTSSQTLIVPTTATTGVYTVTSVTVTDRAGNIASYSAAQLAALGFATSVSITGGRVAGGSPVIAVDGHPTFIASGASPTLSGSVSDTVALSSVQVFNGTTLLGNATINSAAHTWTFSTTLSAGSYSSLSVTARDVNGSTASAKASYALQTGITGQAYVTIESDYSNTTLIGKRFIRADGSLYQADVFNTNGTEVDTVYGVTGQAYTSYEVDYAVGGHFTAQKYFGYTGQPYVTVELDYSYNGSYRLAQKDYIRANGTYYLVNIFNTDGSQGYIYYGITGQSYTSYEIDYDVSNRVKDKKYFGYIGQTYTSVEYDYNISGLLTLQSFYKSDNSLYLTISFNDDSSKIYTYFGVTGQAYTSYEVDYNASGRYTAIRYFGYSGQSYTTAQYDYSYTTSYRLLDIKFIKLDGSLFQLDTFNPDGTFAYTYYGITGRPYTSYEVDYAANSRYTAIRYFGYSGQTYKSLEYDYSYTTSYRVIGEKFYNASNVLYFAETFAADGSFAYIYYGVTGQPYTTNENDYNAAGYLTAKKYFGYSGQPYTSSIYDYSYNGSGYTLLDVKFLRSNGSLYLTETFNANGSQVFTYYGITGQAYTSNEVDYDVSHHITAQKYFGYTGQPYVSVEKDFNASNTLTEEKFFRADASLYEDETFSASGTAARFYGITGQSYTSYEDDYNTAGTLTREVFYAANGSPNEIKTHNSDGSLTDGHYQITGTTYSSYEVTTEANGTERSQTFNFTDGTHEIDGEENNIVLTSTGGDDRIFGNGSGGTIGDGSGVTFQFNAGFGHDTLYDFYQHVTASDANHLADLIQLPKAEFATFAAFQQAAQPVSGANAIVATASNGDSLTLYGLSVTSLQAAQNDFKFV